MITHEVNARKDEGVDLSNETQERETTDQLGRQRKHQ